MPDGVAQTGAFSSRFLAVEGPWRAGEVQLGSVLALTLLGSERVRLYSQGLLRPIVLGCKRYRTTHGCHPRNQQINGGQDFSATAFDPSLQREGPQPCALNEWRYAGTMPSSQPRQPSRGLPHGLICAHANVAGRQGVTPSQPEYVSPRWRVPFAKRPGYGLFAFTLAVLREQLPTPYPTIVRTSDVPPEVDGFCVRRATRFVIQIDRKLSCAAAIQTLLHEWAHARAWNHRLDQVDRESANRDEFEAVCHGPEFGAAYAEAWRLLTTRILPAWRREGARRAGSAAAGGAENGAAAQGAGTLQ